jgi:hypothetical protein
MNDTVPTKSLWCSAYLLLKGHKFITFDLVTPYKGYFVFKKSKRLEKDIAEYYETNPQVPIKDYLRQYDALRDLVMQSKRKANKNIRRLT